MNLAGAVLIVIRVRLVALGRRPKVTDMQRMMLREVAEKVRDLSSRSELIELWRGVPRAGCGRHQRVVLRLIWFLWAAESARQAALRQAEVEQDRQRWAARVGRRRAVAASGDEAMVDAVANIGLLDPEPGADVDRAEQEAAVRRLDALADRAPQVFTPEIVALAVELVAYAGVAQELVEPLRRLARARSEFASQVVHAALVELRRGPLTAAGRCVADFAAAVRATRMTVSRNRPRLRWSCDPACRTCPVVDP